MHKHAHLNAHQEIFHHHFLAGFTKFVLLNHQFELCHGLNMILTNDNTLTRRKSVGFEHNGHW